MRTYYRILGLALIAMSLISGCATNRSFAEAYDIAREASAPVQQPKSFNCYTIGIQTHCQETT